MEFKIGDYVKIKSLDWYEKNKDEKGRIDCETHYFIKNMTKYCGNIYNILSIYEDKSIILDDSMWQFTEEMIECIVSEDAMLIQSTETEDIKYDFPKEDHTINMRVETKSKYMTLEQFTEKAKSALCKMKEANINVAEEDVRTQTNVNWLDDLKQTMEE